MKTWKLYWSRMPFLAGRSTHTKDFSLQLTSTRTRKPQDNDSPTTMCHRTAAQHGNLKTQVHTPGWGHRKTTSCPPPAEAGSRREA